MPILERPTIPDLQTTVTEVSFSTLSASTTAAPVSNSSRVSINRLVIIFRELFSPRRSTTPGVNRTSARPSSVRNVLLTPGVHGGELQPLVIQINLAFQIRDRSRFGGSHRLR